MKTLFKVVLIIALVLVLLGAGLVAYTAIRGVEIAALMLPDGSNAGELAQLLTDDSGRLDLSKELNLNAADPISKLRLYAGAGMVQLVSGPEFDIIFSGNERNLRLSNMNGLLLINFNEQTRLRDWLGLGKVNANSRLTVVVPEQYHFDSVDIRIAAGRLLVNDRLNADSVHINVEAGAMTVQALQAQTAQLSIGAGAMLLRGYDVMDGEIDCNCGSVSLRTADNAELRGRIEVDLGSLVLDERRRGGSLELDFGHIDTARQLNVNCDLGAVEIRTK